jgi:trehalose synthase
MKVLPVISLNKYEGIIGEEKANKIRDDASELSEYTVAQINSTYQGGGVAEILNSLIILLNDVGIRTDWRVLHGDLDFFTITKKFHNASQGDKINFTKKKKELYFINNVNNAIFTHINHDFVVVHDPQPLPIISCYEKKQPWIWRCHIDITSPYPALWQYLKTFISQYDTMIISMEEFKDKDAEASIPYRIIKPSIDPLNIKNRDISEDTIQKYLLKSGIKLDKPIISQISRFDKWKDPEGMVKIFKIIKNKHIDCQLILVGSMATDDPEGQEVFEKLERIVEKEKDIHLIMNAPDIVINAIQRASSVVVQKSLKEGFAITVSEALWKKTPVVASNVGGIPSQVIDGKNGFLLHPTDYQGFADKIIYLLNNSKKAEEMGKFGKQYVKDNFLITRHLSDYIQLFKELKKEKMIDIK